MSHLRSLPKAALAAALVLVAAACTSAAADGTSSGTTATTRTKAEAESLLYVERADGGRFEPVNAKARTFDLHLSGADVDAMYFTDRPARRAGEMTFAKVLDELGVMKGRDLQSPPNATLVVNGGASVPLEVQHVERVKGDDVVLAVRLLERGAYAKSGKPVDLPAKFGSASLFIDDGTDLGYRSIEVVITNDTRGNLMIGDVQTDAGSAWVAGETPSQSQQLNQFVFSTFAVMTTDINASAGGQIMLTGLGSYPISVVFANSVNGTNNAMVNGNDMVTGRVTPIDTGEQNHTMYNVQLVPVE